VRVPGIVLFRRYHGTLKDLVIAQEMEMPQEMDHCLPGRDPLVREMTEVHRHDE